MIYYTTSRHFNLSEFRLDRKVKRHFLNDEWQRVTPILLIMLQQFLEKIQKGA